MKAIWIIGAIANLYTAGNIWFTGYLPSTISLVIAYTAVAVWMVSLAIDD